MTPERKADLRRAGTAMDPTEVEEVFDALSSAESALSAAEERTADYKREVERRDELLAGAYADLATTTKRVEEAHGLLREAQGRCDEWQEMQHETARAKEDAEEKLAACRSGLGIDARRAERAEADAHEARRGRNAAGEELAASRACVAATPDKECAANFRAMRERPHRPGCKGVPCACDCSPTELESLRADLASARAERDSATIDAATWRTGLCDAERERDEAKHHDRAIEEMLTGAQAEVRELRAERDYARAERDDLATAGALLVQEVPAPKSSFAAGYTAALKEAAKKVTEMLALNSQREVSWHEVQDCAAAILALPVAPKEKP